MSIYVEPAEGRSDKDGAIRTEILKTDQAFEWCSKSRNCRRYAIFGRSIVENVTGRLANPVNIVVAEKSRLSTLYGTVFVSSVLVKR